MKTCLEARASRSLIFTSQSIGVNPRRLDPRRPSQQFRRIYDESPHAVRFGLGATRARASSVPGTGEHYCTKNEVSNVACLPPDEHVTVIGHSPGVVRVPTIHAQLTTPSLSAVFGISP